MSLLNDALKRVKRHVQHPPPFRETADYPFRPIDYEKPSTVLPVLWMGLGVVALLLLSGFLFFKWVGGQHNDAVTTTDPSAGSVRRTEPPPLPATAPARVPALIRGSNQTAAPQKGLIPTNAAAISSNLNPLAVSPSSPFSNIRLQGIYYRTTSKSSVLINGETLEEGDLFQEVRVKKIDRKSVTLEWHGQEKVLTLR